MSAECEGEQSRTQGGYLCGSKGAARGEHGADEVRHVLRRDEAVALSVHPEHDCAVVSKLWSCKITFSMQ